MARRRSETLLPLLLVAVLAVAVATASASAYARAAVGDDGSAMMMMRRVLDDLNATAAGNATTANSTTGYISYDALFADRVPCSLRGAPYYNCHPGAEANPYTRGCSAISQCRG